ncbi:ferric iron uptake transcriptional regulator [Magnetococcus sp. PR-3]|uniref:ferric iron uptake transcriptional regulator n=1 Tax=Magnetococcus sp. PR-3 TaxID=3120355 RepID=UPI002FCE2357
MRDQAEINQELKSAGLKATAPRRKILELFQANPESHWSAEDVYKTLLEMGDEIGLATVYRVLTQFEQAGLLTRHHFEAGKAIFELSGGGHHDHFVCMDCGHVEEFFDQQIEDRQNQLAEDRGFKVTAHALYLYVNCIRENCPNRK